MRCITWRSVFVLVALGLHHACAKKESEAEKSATVEAKTRKVASEPSVPVEKALQLVKVSGPDGKLQMTPEGRKWLEALRGAPIKVVAISGTYQGGKSSLLNRLVGSRAFVTGSAAGPTTRGLWAAHSNGILFVDCEGQAAVGALEATDGKLFATTALFSSLLLFNSRQIVDARQLEYLDLLTRRASLFALRAALRNVKQADAWVTVPPLLWVMQNVAANFSADGNATAWLGRLVAEQGSMLGSALLEPFAAVEAMSLPTPTADVKALREVDLIPSASLATAYSEALDNLSGLVRAAKPKLIGGVAASGAELAQLLATLVEAANEGLVPALPSVWTAFQEHARAASRGDCTKAYDALMEEEFQKTSSQVLTDEQVEALHQRGMQVCAPLLAAADTDAASTLNVRRQQLVAHFNGTQERACASVREQARRTLTARCASLELPMASKDVESWVTKEVQQALTDAARDTEGLGCTELVASLSEDLEGAVATLKVNNFKSMTQTLLTLGEKTKDALTVPELVSNAELAHARDAVLAKWAQDYGAGSVFAEGEHFTAFYQAQAREHALERVNQLLVAAQAAAARIVEEAATRAKGRLSAALGALRVPAVGADLAQEASAALGKERAALQKEFPRFAEDPVFTAALEALRAAKQTDLEAKLSENRKVVIARVMPMIDSCYTVGQLQDHIISVTSPSQVTKSAQSEAASIAAELAVERPILLLSIYAPLIGGSVVVLLFGCIIQRLRHAPAKGAKATA